MLPLNIIDAAQYAYKIVWQERHYLLKLAFVPLIIKLLCFFAAVHFDDSNSIIRLSLFMLPAYFAEGWMLCHFVALMTKGQRWPMMMTGNQAQDLKTAKRRGRPLVAGILGFVLINMAMALYFQTFTNFVPPEMLAGEAVDPNALPPQNAFIITMMFVLMIVVFKYVWLYIPLASDAGLMPYIHKTRGFMMSLRFIALWVLCFLPTIFIMQVFMSLVSFQGNGEHVNYAAGLIRVLLDTVKNLICTAGFTFVMLQLFNGQQKGGKL
ncbi:MAG: hypothetical protein GW903_07435 [Alphaproteobacteria bacterium]|nr:hypothetical protein [Alphaproteobacteria bacterium]NCQ88717.1 hypothetical protein [Alphaproteobacteria bacterium]NCT08185.1 hypothetical protein [Alphaproteobacteria bacterium]